MERPHGIEYMESLVFANGGTPKRHPVTGMCLETGIGHASDDNQAIQHCRVIAQQQGKAAGDAMLKKVMDYIASEKANAEADAAQAQVKADGVTIPTEQTNV
jgi:hypothetical protein